MYYSSSDSETDSDSDTSSSDENEQEPAFPLSDSESGPEEHSERRVVSAASALRGPQQQDLDLLPQGAPSSTASFVPSFLPAGDAKDPPSSASFPPILPADAKDAEPYRREFRKLLAGKLLSPISTPFVEDEQKAWKSERGEALQKAIQGAWGVERAILRWEAGGQRGRNLLGDGRAFPMQERFAVRGLLDQIVERKIAELFSGAGTSTEWSGSGERVDVEEVLQELGEALVKTGEKNRGADYKEVFGFFQSVGTSGNGK